MNTSPSRLSLVQRWMQTVIMHPDGVDGIDSAEARCHLDVDGGTLDSVILPSRALTSRQRLEIYIDAYHLRLFDCLREEFPVVRETVGDELFDALAFGYLDHYPSRSYTLNQLGALFPLFLERVRPHGHAGPPGVDGWDEFVVELARFERILREVFDGPGTEGQAPLDAEKLLARGSDCAGDVRLTPSVCLRLLQFRFPVNAWYTAVKSDSASRPAIVRRDEFVAVHRRAYIVKRYEISGEQFDLLTRLTAGEPVGNAVAAVACSRTDAERPVLIGQLREWFQFWAEEAFFQEVTFSSSA